MCIGGRLHGRRCCREPKIQVQEPIKPVPLSGVVVSAKIVDFVAEVTIHQRYVNVEDDPIEATYIFPLAEGASVCSFYAIVNGEKIEGKLKEKEKAKDEYDDAIASGHSAYLLEEQEKQKNVFKASIGNLPPKDEVVITIVYVTELAFTEDKKLEFSIPTNTQAYPDGVVVPRFFDPTIRAEPTKLEKAAVVPPFGLKLDVSFDMTSKIKSISSPSHPIEFNFGENPNNATVALANKDNVGSPLLKDFELRVALANPDSPVFRVQDGVAMLALYPNLLEEDEDPITEMIFLVDRSGSMSGAKIQRVKDTLHIFLRSLPLGTLFNIVGFGSNYVSLFSAGSKEYDDTTLAAATKHVNDLKANLGGTSLYPPLQHIFNQPLREGIPRQVFVLTDGEVDNTSDCIRICRENSTRSRVFAFGIHGASPELVNGIARAGNGKAEIISGNENIEGKVMIQLKRALQPALTDMQINWDNLGVEQTPFKLPPLFGGSRVIAYGYLGPKAQPGTVVFTAKSVKGQYKFEHPVTADDLKPVTDGFKFIPKLAAKSMITDLEEGRSSYHAHSPFFKEGEAKKKVIELSIKSGMLSKFTAFIAVNQNNKAVESTMQTRNVNQQLQSLGVKQKTGAAPANKRFFMSGMTRGRGGGGGGGANIVDINGISSGSDSEEEEADGGFRSASPIRSPRLGGIQSVNLLSADDDDDFDLADKEAPQSLEKLKKKKGKSGDKKERSMPKAPSSARKSSIGSSASSSSISAPAPAAEVSMQAPSAAQSGLREIVLQQKAAGNFSDEVLAKTGGSIDSLRGKVPAQLKAIAAALLDQILVTAFVCGILRKTYSAEADQWSLVEKKALTWIKKEVKKANPDLADFDWNSLATTLAN